MPASITPVFPSWKPISSMLNASCHGSRRQRDAGEDDRLDQRAPDDDRLPAVLVGPHAPQRHERHPDDEDQRREEADEREPLVLGHAHLAQVARDEGEDLADAETFDHRGQPEDREQDVASPGQEPGRRAGELGGRSMGVVVTGAA